MTSPVTTEHASDRAAIDRALDELVARYSGHLAPPVGDAVRYGLSGGGKRLRGLLFLAAYRATGGRGDGYSLAASIEIIHAYSLIHDDLPCMDNDDLRRGRPTVHRVFGVPAATVAGVAMVPLAALCAFHAARELSLSEQESGRIVSELMGASGAGGMIGGQLLDLDGEGLAHDLASLEAIHGAKTGALITATLRVGGLAARASDEAIAALARFGRAIGLAFQIADDVLDVIGTSEQLGKTAGKDESVQKGTYPAILGVDGAAARANALVAEGCDALASEGLLTPELAALARFAVERAS